MQAVCRLGSLLSEQGKVVAGQPRDENAAVVFGAALGGACRKSLKPSFNGEILERFVTRRVFIDEPLLCL
jgi:hypothetical protein